MPRDQVFLAPQFGHTAALAAWQHSLGELALACAGSYAADEPARLRELAALLAAAPEGQAAALPHLDPARLDLLLEVSAGTAAALEMLSAAPRQVSAASSPPQAGPALSQTGSAGYLLSCGGSGQHIASVVLPGAPEESTASGDTAALALVGALALALAVQAGADSIMPERRTQPRSTPH